VNVFSRVYSTVQLILCVLWITLSLINRNQFDNSAFTKQLSIYHTYNLIFWFVLIEPYTCCLNIQMLKFSKTVSSYWLECCMTPLSRQAAPALIDQLCAVVTISQLIGCFDWATITADPVWGWCRAHITWFRAISVSPRYISLVWHSFMQKLIQLRVDASILWNKTMDKFCIGVTSRLPSGRIDTVSQLVGIPVM